MKSLLKRWHDNPDEREMAVLFAGLGMVAVDLLISIIAMKLDLPVIVWDISMIAAFIHYGCAFWLSPD